MNPIIHEHTYKILYNLFAYNLNTLLFKIFLKSRYVLNLNLEVWNRGRFPWKRGCFPGENPVAGMHKS